MSTPFHQGEIEVQNLAGERAVATRNGRLIGPRIPQRAIRFIAQQSYFVIGGEGENRAVWAEFLTGNPGFARSDAAGSTVTLSFDEMSGPVAFGRGDSVGMLFIDLSSRRRLRVNGTVATWSADSARISVSEAFPNCSKYIQGRRLVTKNKSVPPVQAIRGQGMTDEIREWVGAADTFFVASAVPGISADVSHRGGAPGFVRIDGTAMTIPDYPGNSMFGTLGNLAVHPKAGIVFPDFEGGRQLQLTGSVNLDLNSGTNSSATGDTGRWWYFTADEWVITPFGHDLEAEYLGASPFNH